MADSVAVPLAGPDDTRRTSAIARDALGLRTRQKAMFAVFEVVLDCRRKGVRDMSLSEIQRAYEGATQSRMDLNRVSARVCDLVNTGWLPRRADTRACAVTGRAVCPVFVPKKQARLFA